MDKEKLLEMKSIEDRHWWFRGKRKIITTIINKLFNKQTPRILEIGCASGYFINKYSGIGIEPSTVFKGQNILNMKIEDYKSEEKFNIILFLDVLEHIKDDKETLNRLAHNNLEQGGKIIITVPANMSLYNEHDISLGHLRRYNKEDIESLTEDLKKEGYNIKIYRYNSILYPIAYIVRRLTKGKNNNKIPNKFINEILYRIFSLERYCLGIFPFGLSYLLIIDKGD